MRASSPVDSLNHKITPLDIPCDSSPHRTIRKRIAQPRLSVCWRTFGRRSLADCARANVTVNLPRGLAATTLSRSTHPSPYEHAQASLICTQTILLPVDADIQVDYSKSQQQRSEKLLGQPFVPARRHRRLSPFLGLRPEAFEIPSPERTVLQRRL